MMRPSSLTVVLAAVTICFSLFHVIGCQAPPPTSNAEELMKVEDGSAVGMVIKGTTDLTETILKGVLGSVLGGVG